MKQQNAGMPTPRRRRRAGLVAPATLLAFALLALLAGAAQALVVAKGQHRVSYELLQRPAAGAQPSTPRRQSKALSKKPLENAKGGPVMTSNTNYAIYWDPSGGAAFPAGYVANLNKYFEDVATDSGLLTNTDSVLTQYGAGYNSHFGGAYIDTDPYPSPGCHSAPTCFTEAQLESEIAAFVSAHSLPTDLEHAYFLFTPKGVESCGEAAGKKCSPGTEHPYYCAFHSYIQLSKGAVIVYASDPYVTGVGAPDVCNDEGDKPNGNPSDDTIAAGLAHEHSETVTDPELNAWKDQKGEEVADKCRTEYGTPLGKAPNGSSFNEEIGGDLFWYQEVWSNEIGGCTQRQLQAPTIKKMSPKKGLETGGTVVTITGTGFIAGATVDFGEKESPEVKVESPTTIVATSPPGTGIVPVTVTTEGGTSAATNKTRFKYKKPKGH
jgi:hypothetical protein